MWRFAVVLLIGAFVSWRVDGRCVGSPEAVSGAAPAGRADALRRWLSRATQRKRAERDRNPSSLGQSIAHWKLARRTCVISLAFRRPTEEYDQARLHPHVAAAALPPSAGVFGEQHRGLRLPPLKGRNPFLSASDLIARDMASSRRVWATNQERQSPHHTTRWAETPVVKAR